MILNWNGQKFLEQFLPTVKKYSLNSIIYVVDNNSSDSSVFFLKKYHEEVNLILLDNNEGFCRGYNLALAQIKAEYYILLNSDVEVTHGWLDPVINFMDSKPEIAACQPKIKSFKDKEYFEYAGAAGGFIDKFGYPFCRGRIFDTVEKDNGQYNDICEIFWATGACLIIKSEYYWKVGGLDDLFFAHMEEIDLAWRIKNLGLKIYYYGLSEVYHVGGGTLNKSNPIKTYLNFRNGLYLLYKNLPSNKLYFILFVRMILDGLAAFKFLISFSFSHFIAIFKGHISFYKNLRKLQNKKKQYSLVDSYPNCIYMNSLVYVYFIRKKKFFKEIW